MHPSAMLRRFATLCILFAPPVASAAPLPSPTRPDIALYTFINFAWSLNVNADGGGRLTYGAATSTAFPPHTLDAEKLLNDLRAGQVPKPAPNERVTPDHALPLQIDLPAGPNNRPAAQFFTTARRPLAAALDRIYQTTHHIAIRELYLTHPPFPGLTTSTPAPLPWPPEGPDAVIRDNVVYRRIFQIPIPHKGSLLGLQGQDIPFSNVAPVLPSFGAQDYYRAFPLRIEFISPNPPVVIASTLVAEGNLGFDVLDVLYIPDGRFVLALADNGTIRLREFTVGGAVRTTSLLQSDWTTLHGPFRINRTNTTLLLSYDANSTVHLMVLNREPYTFTRFTQSAGDWSFRADAPTMKYVPPPSVFAQPAGALSPAITPPPPIPHTR